MNYKQEFRDFLDESIKIVKLNLPKSSRDFNLNWNDDFTANHSMYSRIQRTGLTRKEVISKIIFGIDKLSQRMQKNDGVYIIKFTVSEFYLVCYMEDDFKTLNIKTILDYEMIPRKKDTVLTISESENIFKVDLSEFKETMVSGLYGSLLIENTDKTEVFIDCIFEVEF